MRFAFYKGGKGLHGRKRFVTWIVKFVTRGKYAHVELDFQNNYRENCFSSSAVEKPFGVRFRRIKFSHPSRWDFVEVKGKNVKELRKKCTRYLGMKYDWKGIINYFWFRRKRHDKNKWFCSEIICHILNIKPEQISPSKLYKIIKELYD